MHRRLVIGFLAIAALAACNNASTFASPPDENGAYLVLAVDAETAAASADALTQSVRVLQRRVPPQWSVSETADGRILVRSPETWIGPDARATLTQRGALTFHLVHELSAEEAAAGAMPPDAILAQPYPGSDAYAEVVERQPRLSGDRLTRADAATEPNTREFVLVFYLDAEGARQFCTITQTYVNRRFAVLIDDQVLTAPHINEPICGGEGQISGNFTAETTARLARLLRTGALPASLTIVAEGVGPLPAAP